MTRPIAYRENDGRSWRCDGCGSRGRAVSATDGRRIAAETVAVHVDECTPAAAEPTPPKAAPQRTSRRW